MYLSTTSEVIRVKTDATATTDESVWYSASKTLTTSTGRLSALVPNSGLTTGTTVANVVAAPASGQNKQCVGITVINADTVEHDYTFEFYDGTNARPIHYATLQPGEKVEYDRGAWRTYSAGGILLGEQSVSDHGLLSGLADDDHTQYHNDTRGDARYYTQTQLDGGGGSTGLTTDFTADRQLITNGSGKLAVVPGAGYFGGLYMKPASGIYLTNSNQFAITTWGHSSHSQRIGPFAFPWEVEIDRIGFCNTTTASASARVVIFDSDANGRPTTLLAESADVSLSSATYLEDTSFSFTFEPFKVYWIGTWLETGVTLRCHNPYAAAILSITAAATPSRHTCLERTLTWGTSNTDWVYAAGQEATNYMPIILMRVA